MPIEFVSNTPAAADSSLEIVRDTVQGLAGEIERHGRVLAGLSMASLVLGSVRQAAENCKLGDVWSKMDELMQQRIGRASTQLGLAQGLHRHLHTEFPSLHDSSEGQAGNQRPSSM